MRTYACKCAHAHMQVLEGAQESAARARGGRFIEAAHRGRKERGNAARGLGGDHDVTTGAYVELRKRTCNAHINIHMHMHVPPHSSREVKGRWPAQLACTCSWGTGSSWTIIQRPRARPEPTAGRCLERNSRNVRGGSEGTDFSFRLA